MTFPLNEHNKTVDQVNSHSPYCSCLESRSTPGQRASEEHLVSHHLSRAYQRRKKASKRTKYQQPGVYPTHDQMTHQLQSALAKYLFANCLCNTWDHPSPKTALPPFATVLFALFRSAPGPVNVELTIVVPPWTGCPGSSDSSSPSWPAGIKSKVDWLDAGVGSAAFDTLVGIARRA